MVNVTALVVDSNNNNIWAVTQNFLEKFEANNWEIMKSENTNEFPDLCCFSSLAVDSNNTLYIGMYSNYKYCPLATYKGNLCNFYGKEIQIFLRDIF